MGYVAVMFEGDCDISVNNYIIYGLMLTDKSHWQTSKTFVARVKATA